ncbi:MAG: Uncharacterized protein FD123_2669 [Bacteroidetes bacterium]|nr:MAG: Uncharacterized protein FD123_2669 [Bacteroidota bacterium]
MAADPKYNLRIAIFCRGYAFQDWEAECIRQVLSLPYTEPVLLVAEENETGKTASVFSRIFRYPYRRFLWRFYNRFLLRINIYDAVNMQEEFSNVPMIRCKPVLRGKFSQHFSEHDLQQVRQYRPDIILRFGFNILRGEILTAATYGIWSYHHADEQRIRGGPAAFWEIYRGYPSTGAILQRLTDKLDAGIILRKGHFGTVRHSYAANLEQVARGSAGWMRQVCIDIHHNKAHYFSDPPVSTQARVYRNPVNWQVKLFWFKLFTNKITFHWNELFRAEYWNVGIVRQPLESIISRVPPAEVEWLSDDEKSKYKADPFGFIREGKEIILYEKYDYKTGKGHIAQYAGGTETVALETATHLSFPFVLQQNGETTVIPEAHESGAATAYTWNNGRLEKKSELLAFPAVDPGIIRFNDRWWLFCTRADDGANHLLHIYFSDTAEGPWEPHANNPVKCDIRSARPAGAPFIKDGKLYRPGQDCAEQYGRAVVLHEVLELTPVSFREASVQRLEPHAGWKYHDGLHHVSPLGENAYLLDAKTRRFSKDNFKRVLGKKFKRTGK